MNDLFMLQILASIELTILNIWGFFLLFSLFIICAFIGFRVLQQVTRWFSRIMQDRQQMTGKKPESL